MNTAQFQTTINESSFEGIAPVYTKYDSEFQTQPAYIRMDEDGEIDAWVNGEINGTPMSVWHGRTLTWRVPSNVRGEALLEFVKERQHLFERVYLGHEVDWDGNNHVGKLDADAQEASEEIEQAAEVLHDETVDVCSMEEWMRASGSNKLADMWAADQSLEEAAQEAEESARDALSDGVWIEDPGSAKDVLIEWAADEFRSHPERLLACHFEALITEGEVSFEDAVEVIDDEELEIGLYKEVNEAGAQEILNFLQANHQRGGSIFNAADAKGWIEDANFQLAEGNVPTVEIGAEYSTHGYAITYTVSDVGVSVRAEDAAGQHYSHAPGRA